MVMGRIMNNSINILHVVRSFDVSGRSRFIHDICAYDNINSMIAVLADDCGYKQEKCDVINLGIKDGFSPAVVVKLVGIISKYNIKVVHSHGRGAFIYSALAKILRPGIKLIHTVHRADGDLISNNKIVRRILLKKTDKVVAVSQAAADKFSEKNQYPVDKIKIIYNGIDINSFFPGNKKSDDIIIGTVANLSDDKDIETLLRAFALVLDRVEAKHNLFLRIIGDGPRAGELKTLAEELGISGLVEFAGFRNDVAEQLRMMDIFILATRTEGFGISILEAMASGVPVIASRVGGIPEIIEDGINGLLFESGNENQLTDKILQLLGDAVGAVPCARPNCARPNHRGRPACLPAPARTLIDNGLEIVREKFSREKMREKYAKEYIN